MYLYISDAQHMLLSYAKIWWCILLRHERYVGILDPFFTLKKINALTRTSGWDCKTEGWKT